MKPPASPWTVFLVDDHPVIGAGFELATLKSPMFDWIGEAANLSEAAARLDKMEPDVLILDLVIDKEIGVSSICELRAAWPKTHVVVFSSMPATLYAQACMAEGALAYFEKSDSPTQVLSKIAARLTDMSRPRLPAASPPRRHSSSLLLQSLNMTPREEELLSFLAQGQSAREIAAVFGKSSKTISAQRDTIRRKLGCRSTREMTALLSRILSQGP